MERKKRSKGSVWEFCYANKFFGTFGVEMRACGQKLVKFCLLTHAAKLVVRIMCSCACSFAFAHWVNAKEHETHKNITHATRHCDTYFGQQYVI